MQSSLTTNTFNFVEFRQRVVNNPTTEYEQLFKLFKTNQAEAFKFLHAMFDYMNTHPVQYLVRNWVARVMSELFTIYERNLKQISEDLVKFETTGIVPKIDFVGVFYNFLTDLLPTMPFTSILRCDIDAPIKTYFETLEKYVKLSNNPQFNGGENFDSVLNDILDLCFSNVTVFSVFEEDDLPATIIKFLRAAIERIGEINVYNIQHFEQFIMSLNSFKKLSKNKLGPFLTGKIETVFKTITKEFQEYGIFLTNEQVLQLSKSTATVHCAVYAVCGRLTGITLLAGRQSQEFMDTLLNNTYNCFRRIYDFYARRDSACIIDLFQFMAENKYHINLKLLCQHCKYTNQVSEPETKSILFKICSYFFHKMPEKEMHKWFMYAFNNGHYWLVDYLVKHKRYILNYNHFIETKSFALRTYMIKTNPKLLTKLTKTDYIKLMIEMSHAKKGTYNEVSTFFWLFQRRLCKLHDINMRTMMPNNTATKKANRLERQRALNEMLNEPEPDIDHVVNDIINNHVDEE
jgi:hypothetical protein